MGVDEGLDRLVEEMITEVDEHGELDDTEDLRGGNWLGTLGPRCYSGGCRQNER